MGLPVPVSPGLGSGLAPDAAQLGREITLLTAQINVANYRLLKLIAEFDVLGGWRCGGAMRSCAHWLAANCGMTIGAARERVRVARRLAGLPEVEQAFSTGELSYSKVRAVTRVATATNESLLLAMAERTSASHLEQLVARYQPVDELGLAGMGALEDAEDEGAAAGVASGEAGLDEEAGSEVDEEARREHARELYWFQDEDGMWVIHGRLPPEQGQLVVKALEAVTRPIQEERQDEWKAKQKARLQAVARHIARRHREAGVDVVGGVGSDTGVGVAGDVDGDAGVAADSGADSDELAGAGAGAVPLAVEVARAEEKISAETFSQFMNQVRADAFAGMAEHFLATAGDFRQLQGLTGSERCQVVLHVDVNTLREQRAGVCCAHAKAHFEDKPWLSPRTARRLGCDASLVTVLEGEDGKVLNVGRRSRIVPAHIRRALLERDGVCRYPGCHESRYVDAHHLDHWADGGETSLDNLVTLCRFHHRQLHRGCFEVLAEDDSAEISGSEPRLVFREIGIP
jgi:Domain of unknown function (DUF222)/HNH endonuclease